MERFQRENNAFFQQLLFLVALIGIGVVIYKHLGFLLSCFLGAITVYIVFRKPLFYLTEQKGWKSWKAALVLLIAVILLLLGILFVVFQIILSEVHTLNIDNLIADISGLIDEINGLIGYPFLSKQLITNSQGKITSMLTGLLNTSYNVAINFFLMLIVLYFMFASGRKMESRIFSYIPFQGHCLVLLKREVKEMIYGNAIGIPLIMLVQAIVSGIGYLIIGSERVFFLAFLTALFGLIPVIGTAAVWLPLSVYLFATGQIWQAIVILLYGIIIIANSDNACRMVLMKKMADTHPLIVIFGVILGIPLFGFWGIIFGPLLISGFMLLIKIYFVEYYQDKSCDDMM